MKFIKSSERRVIGKLAYDPEFRFTASGQAICTIQVDGITCTAWGTTAEDIAESFTAGQMIVLCGLFKTRNYEDREGQKHTVEYFSIHEFATP